jgi:glycosyltransferase involved in cell wall biosynthesis
MQMFAENGNRVLYIETAVHLLGIDVLPGDPLRALRFMKGPRPVAANLWVATLPLLLPFFQMSARINKWNHRLIRLILTRWTRTLRFDQPLLWVYTPFSEALIDMIGHSEVIYECVDEFRAAKGLLRPSVIGAMEESLLKKSDLCIVTQETLLARRLAFCPKTFCVPNGADIDLFQAKATNGASAIDNVSHPRLIFVGHIQYWVDLRLIRYLADQRPQWSLVLVGPVHPLADGKVVKGVTNIYLMGRLPHAQIPGLLNPYKPDDVALHASPLKLYEYLAAGKPVVSSDMPEARKFSPDVRIASSREDFLKECEEVLRSLPESASTVANRQQLAASSAWKNRFREVNTILDSILRERTARFMPHNSTTTKNS